MGIGLDVVGVGPARSDLMALAGPTVTFHGRLDDAAVTEMFERCRAYCLPGREDFGISPVEAQAAGKPVIAFARGGALETVEDGVSGVFFEHQRVESVIDAIVRCDQLDAPAKEIAALASRFSAKRFGRHLTETILAARASHNG